MRPKTFDYFAPSTLTEALNLLSSTEDTKILAGGQSLITMMKLHLVSPNALIDINGVPELTSIREDDGELVVGALTRHDQLARNLKVRSQVLLLAEAADLIADQQVRNRGTIGGSLAHADPTADLPTAITALNATIVVTSLKGSRPIPSRNFFRDYYTTALTEGEIIKEVRISIPPTDSGGAYLKLSKGHNDFALVAVAAQLSLDTGSVCRTANVVLGGVAATPIHANETEKSLLGRRLDDRVIDESATKASEELNPPSDFRASAEYRSRMVRILTKRAVSMALSRAKKGA